MYTPTFYENPTPSAGSIDIIPSMGLEDAMVFPSRGQAGDRLTTLPPAARQGQCFESEGHGSWPITFHWFLTRAMHYAYCHSPIVIGDRLIYKQARFVITSTSKYRITQ